LTGLASIGAGAVLGLHDRAAVSTTGALVNDRGTFELDNGASMSTTGSLANNGGTFELGNGLGVDDRLARQ
jgi:hypothetical protein